MCVESFGNKIEEGKMKLFTGNEYILKRILSKSFPKITIIKWDNVRRTYIGNEIEEKWGRIKKYEKYIKRIKGEIKTLRFKRRKCNG